MAGEIVRIDGTNFTYGYFTDVMGQPTPKYEGGIVQLKDHIRLNHSKVPNPNRVPGLLSNRPVLWVWEGYREWKRFGLPPKDDEVLYLNQGEVEIGGPQMTKGQVIDIAEKAATKHGYNLREYKWPEVHYEFTNKDKTWSVFYEPRLPTVGSQFLVIVKDTTAEADVLPGE